MIFFRVYLVYKWAKLSHMQLILLVRCATLDEIDWSYYLYIFVTYESKLELLHTYFIHIFFTYFPVLLYLYLSDIFLCFFFIEKIKRIIDFFRFFRFSSKIFVNFSHDNNIIIFQSSIVIIDLKLNFCLFRKRLKYYRLFKKS